MSDETQAAALRSLYLDALRRAVKGGADRYPYRFVRRPQDPLAAAIFDALRAQDIEAVTRQPQSRDLYEDGGWAIAAQTMIGERRLKNVQECVETALREAVPGDLIEAGVWRGGATIVMRGVLKAYGVSDRRVWAADSFRGLPAPDAERYAADAGDRHHLQEVLAVGLDEVKANFAAHDLLDEQVRFVEGWFRDTLPALAGERWAVVRLDGDMYESTIQGLEHLYPQLSPGGFLIVDDYGAVRACKRAVEDFRSEHGITEPMEPVDWTAVYWRKRRG